MSTGSVAMSNDLSDLCRVCLQLPEESQFLDLSTIYDEEDMLTYSECFTICTQIDINAGIGIPHNLCKSCGLELQMSYDFYKKVEESKRVLEQYEKQMQEDKIKEQSFVLPKTLPEKNNINKREIPEEEQLAAGHDEQQLSDSSKFLLVEDIHDDPPHDKQEYIGNSDEENGVDILSKIASDVCKDNKINERLVPMEAECIEIEEDLEADDFQNLETLEEEETETLQIKCNENMIPITITKYKEKHGYSEEENDRDGYFAEEDDLTQTEEFLEYNDDNDDNEDTCDNSKWQKNVVAVANKEHIPVVEVEEEYGGVSNEEEEEEEYVIINDIIEEQTTPEELEEEKKMNAKKNIQTISINDKERKRHAGSYSCDFCRKLFPNYSRMKTHRRCHEADRTKFNCVYCGRMYATKQAMECHIKTAHDKQGYICDTCGKVFAIRKSLEIHIRYHTGDFPYECDQCDRKFAQAGHLNTHKNVKHNSLRFSCNYPGCLKNFTSSTSLRSHEYSHGLMPFECEYCQQGYPSKSKLKVHLKNKHGVDRNMEQLEDMRKFHVMRTKANVVKVIDAKVKT